jgi:hypothetical protein
MSSVWSRLVLTVGFGLSALVLWAQATAINPKINSPYSRYGLGNRVEQYFAAPAAMAGMSAAFHDPYHLNILNPASLASLQATAFEVGLDTRYTSLKSTEASEGVWSGNLRYLALGFPLINPINAALDQRNSPWRFGMAFALQPFTEVGYNVEVPSEQPGLGLTTNYLKGSGGTYRLTWNNAASYKGLSGGFTFGYLFGQLSNNRRVEFDSLQGAYISEFLDKLNINGFFWRFGLQYTYDFKKTDASGVRKATGQRIIIGAHGNSSSGFNTKSSRFAERYNFQYQSQDTILDGTIVEQKGALPAALSVGIIYEKINKLKLGAEIELQSWEQYFNESKPEAPLLNTWRASVGAEIIPNYLSYNNYFQRTRYRVGAFYGMDPRSINGVQLEEFGLTAGIGFPIVMTRQRISFINLALEAGRFGLSDTLQENYVKMTLGFTLNDNTWFFKRKFN